MKEKHSTRTLSLVVIHRVRFKETCKEVHYHSRRDETQKKPSILVVFPPVFPFYWVPPLLLKYIFTPPNYATTIIGLEPCALIAEYHHFTLRWSISYWDLLKSLYFADTTERGDRGWKEAQRQGEDRVTLWITLIPWWITMIPMCSNGTGPQVVG
jgi:hypothetical protein